MEADAVAFIKEVSKSFAQIGSVVPSSAALGRAMIRPIREAKRPCRILEVGPGTGPITRQILRHMGSRDSLLICEINPRLMSHLRRSLERNKHYQRHRDRVEFFEGPVQALRKKENFGTFDVVVSSLPFSNFSPHVVDQIFRTYRELLRKGGNLTYVEYIGVRQLGALMSNAQERARVRAVDRVVKKWCRPAARRGAVKREITLLNVPPAFAVQVRL